MKLNNKGFALTSIIYMLIVLFLMIMLLVLSNLAQRKVVLDKIKNDVKNELNQGGILASNSMIVTFDPQGGQLNQTTKEVTYNEPYGELPTPTREGYVFKGWRGKNLFDKDSIPDKNGYYITSSGSETAYGSYAIYKTSVKPNTQYTITNSGKSNAPGYALYDQYHNFITGAGYSNTANVTFTTPANAGYIKFSVVANLSESEQYRYDKDYFQLEEGGSATEYDSYQKYTSNTVVTKQENHTLHAIWEKKEATFIAGPDFNAKIKQLAGNTAATYNTVDTNITSIQRANSLPQTALTDNNIVSTNNSLYPIYAWFNNGTIFYYTEALNPYMNSDASQMFRELRSVETIEIGTLNTSMTTKMNGMFYCSISLETIDLTNFNTKNVSNFSNMFASWDIASSTSLHSSLKEIIGIENFNTSSATNMNSMFADSSIESLDLSNWNTNNVSNMQQMFLRCNALHKLDLSSFNMSNVTATNNILTSVTSLEELTTPSVYPTDNSVTITLPKTLYDESNNSYTTLGSGSPTQTLLKDTQTVAQ